MHNWLIFIFHILSASASGWRHTIICWRILLRTYTKHSIYHRLFCPIYDFRIIFGSDNKYSFSIHSTYSNIVGRVQNYHYNIHDDERLFDLFFEDLHTTVDLPFSRTKVTDKRQTIDIDKSCGSYGFKW